MNPENSNQSAQTNPNPMPTPNPAPMPSMTPMHEERALGPAIGVVIIIFVLVLGGLYFWGQRMNAARIAEEQAKADMMAPVQKDQTDPQVQQLQTQSSSDSLGSIDADLKATNTTNLGTEVNGMNSAANQ